MSEEVKQEGSFKIKKKTPKKLVGKSEVTKVDLTKKEENNAIQEQSTDEVSVRDEPKTSEGVREQDNKETVEEPAGKNNNDDGKTEVETPIQLIEEKDKEEKDATTEEKTELKQKVSRKL